MIKISRGQLTVVAKPYHGHSKVIERLFKSVDIKGCIKKKARNDQAVPPVKTDKRA